MTKMKLAARNTNAEAAIDNSNAKLAQIERAKSKIQEEINEMSTNLDQAQVADAAMERKAKQFNKTISRYKGKLDHLSFDLDVSQKTRPLIGMPNPEEELAAQDKLDQREQARQDAKADKKVLEQEVVAIKKDIDNIMVAIQKLEQEKTNRDHTIKSVNDETANQYEVINKLNKEKKHISENAAKSMEDLQVAEDKV